MNYTYTHTTFPAKPGVRPHSSNIVIKAAIACWLLAASSLQSSLSWGEEAFKSYATPTTHSFPTRIAIDISDNIWFIESNYNKIGRYRIGKGEFSEHAIPTPSSIPTDVAVGSSGKIWLTESNANQIGAFDPASQTFKEYDVPTIESMPSRIAVDPSGNVWFTEFFGNKVGMFDPKRETPIPTPSSRPAGIITDKNGVIWFLETQGNKLSRLDPRDGKIREFDLPNKHESPRDLAMDKSGMIWFGGNIGRNLMMFNPATRKFKTHTMHDGSVVEAMAASPDGKLYFSLKTSSKIGVFDPKAGKFLEIDVAVGKSRPNGIGVDSKGNIWFADTEKSALFRMDAAMVQNLWLK